MGFCVVVVFGRFWVDVVCNTLEMTPQDHRDCAAALLEAEVSGEQINLLSLTYPQIDMDDAYAIQSEILKAKLAMGRSVIGYKIGLTSRAMQMALNIDIPDSGILFDDMYFEDGSTVPAGRFISPRVECEIAFVMGGAIDGDVSREDVLAATDYVCPSIEILDTRIVRNDPVTGQGRIVFDTIADNAANGGVVLGSQRHSVADFDLRWVGVLAARDGQIEETGLGAGVLDDPVESVIWLARRMSQYGQRIEAGNIVLSGSFIRPIDCAAGSVITADFADFGSVSVSFA